MFGEQTFALLRTGLRVRTVSVDVQQHFKKKKKHHRVQELCEGRGGCPRLPVLIVPTVPVDVKQHLKKKKKHYIP